MLNALKDFFDRHVGAVPGDDAETAAEKAQLAAAALMMEVALSDQRLSDEERQSLLASAQRKFGLSADKASELLTLAEKQARDAHDLFQFTSKVNASFTPDQKAKLIEEMWRAAYADGSLSDLEEHVICRVADLLHVPHARFIAAKLRVLGTQD